MNEVAKGSDKLFTMMFNQRTNCVYRKMHEMIHEGQLGTIKRINRIITTWYRSQSYYDSGDWRATWRGEGGGVMINQALHTLDLSQWIAGMPERVVAHIATDHLGGIIETEDTAMARFTCPDGTVFHFFATVAANVNLAALLRVRLATGERIEAENDLLVIDNQIAPPAARDPYTGKTEWGTGHRRLIADFYRCIETHEHFPIDAEEGARVVRMILAMYRSNGKTITIA